MGPRAKNVDQYIDYFPETTRLLLHTLRDVIKKAAPEAIELISYGMPAYKHQGILVYFAAYKNHIGFYPTSSPIKFFKDELKKFKTSKGAIQFPIEKRIPVVLVKKIVKFRVKENEAKQQLKKKK
jgi:uncharacterized protein YdhG (YjbR/CyaY superfamily)